MNDIKEAVGELELVKEAKVAQLLGGSEEPRMEASGVLAKDGLFYVIFDSSAYLGLLNDELLPGNGHNRLVKFAGGKGSGYEDIAYDRSANRLYVLIEALPRDHGYMARVEEYDESIHCVSSRWLDFPLDRPNKGLEGLTCIHRDGRTYLLGLCEGNRCRAGEDGRKPGGGRIQIFTAGREHWEHAGTIRLPKSVWFVDYSSLTVAGDRIAVVSQESSALWVGRFQPTGWELAGDGEIYLFPRAAGDRIVYGNVEGVSWIGPDRVVVVSDRAKPGEQHAAQAAKDESIHVFAIPGSA